MRSVSTGFLVATMWIAAVEARGQNDWQSPDPYFGVFQHRQAATPQAERAYRAEIAPQQSHRLHEQRLHDQRGPADHGGHQPPFWRPRSARFRPRTASGR